MGAQRAHDVTEDEPTSSELSLARIRRIQDRIASDNPDMTDEDWDRLADQWAADANEGIRQHVIKQREEAEQRTA